MAIVLVRRLLLFRLGEPAQVAAEGFVVLERGMSHAGSTGGVSANPECCVSPRQGLVNEKLLCWQYLSILPSRIRMKFWLLDLWLAMRSVLRQGRRTMIAIAAVSFGVVAMILAAGFIEWLMDGMRESTIKSQLGHIQIVRPGYVERGTADPFGFLIEGEDAARAVVEASPGVEVVAPRLSFNGLASKGENTFAFLGQGVSARAEAVLSSSITITRGRNLSAGWRQ
jgi:hypothetical protein